MQLSAKYLGNNIKRTLSLCLGVCRDEDDLVNRLKALPCSSTPLRYFWSILLLVIIALSLGIKVPVLASMPFSNYTPAQTQPSQPDAPPQGCGNTAPALIQGDQNSMPVPSGNTQSEPVYGTNFAHQSETSESKINLLVDDPVRGTQVVLTFNPQRLSGSQVSGIEGLLGGSLNGNQDITVSKETLEAIQDILSPYPGTTNDALPNKKDGGPRKFIDSDLPGNGYPKYATSEPFQSYKPSMNPTELTKVQKMGPREVIREFCRYLIKAGVVCACIFMILAATSAMFGNRNAGAQVIASAGGLILLLMSYSIWKIVMVNTWNARPASDQNNAGEIGQGQQNWQDIEAVDLSKPQTFDLPSRAYDGDTDQAMTDPNRSNLEQSDTPGVPNAVIRPPQRSGLPLMPLGAAH